MIVVDLGCYEHEVSDSVDYLVARFRPALLYGFDPLLERDHTRLVKRTRCVLRASAAWVHTGTLALHRNGTGTRVLEPGEDVPCFDLAEFVRDLPPTRIVLKLDVEGAEYPLLERLHAQGLDSRLEVVLVEWHRPERVELDCPVEEWTM